jgi:hypothetical protein
VPRPPPAVARPLPATLAVGVPAVSLAAVAALGYGGLATAWTLWVSLVVLGGTAALAAAAGVRVALPAAGLPVVLAVVPVFAAPAPGPATALVVDIAVATVAFWALAGAEYGLRNPQTVRRALDRRTRRTAGAGAALAPLSFLLARTAAGYGVPTADLPFVVGAAVWTLGGLGTCGTVAGGFLGRGAYAPATVLALSLSLAAGHALAAVGAGGPSLVSALTLLGAGWPVPFVVLTAAGAVEWRVRFSGGGSARTG